ncbi:hypothetical protein PGB90_000536 [Kerria lacca]
MSSRKHKYRKEVVKKYIVDIAAGREITIIVLDAMLMIDKAWRNVTTTTIANCFKACGFTAPEETIPYITETDDVKTTATTISLRYINYMINDPDNDDETLQENIT